MKGRIEELKDFNILYNLRIQKERQEKELIPSLQEYHNSFGIKFENINPGQLIMHPGPINRGVEIDSQSADALNSVILDQVEMGVALRMAVIFLLGQNKKGT
jgi:aspartate carbamoyltransferase catalytic subunit